MYLYFSVLGVRVCYEDVFVQLNTALKGYFINDEFDKLKKCGCQF